MILLKFAMSSVFLDLWCLAPEMLLICNVPVSRPLVFTVKKFNQPFWKNAFKVFQQNYVVLAVVIYPALIAFPRMFALHFTCGL